jgi:hypothetical protein
MKQTAQIRQPPRVAVYCHSLLETSGNQFPCLALKSSLEVMAHLGEPHITFIIKGKIGRTAI